MRATATIEGVDRVPIKPVLVIPNRLDATMLDALEQALGGKNKVAWMVENSLPPAADVLQLLKKKEANGFFFSAAQTSHEALLARIEARFEAGQHVALLVGGQAQRNTTATADVPPALLRYLLHEYPHSALPVYAGMYNPKQPPLVTTAAPYEKTLLTIMPPVNPAEATRVQTAWMEAAADQISSLPTQSETMPQALLRSLLAHPNAKVIDGIDDTQMTYRQLLVRAATLARELRRHVANKRIGIILPPGKFSIIANVACLLAGITPVNIDYTYDSAAFESVARQAELNRIITEHRFIQMQQDFPWPLTRDILFIDDVSEISGLHMPALWSLMGRFMTTGRLAKWIQTPLDIAPEDEALAIFSPASEGLPVHGSALSHKAVLTGAALCYSRFHVGAGQRVLSALPYHHRAGLLAGLVHPLLMGQDIITYPLPGNTVGACKRLCHLAHKYKAAMAIFTPEQAADVLAQAAEGDFAATTHFHIAGRVPDHLAEQAYRVRHIHLCACYLPQECAMPIACSAPPPAAEGMAAPLRTAAQLPLPGVAVRITDMDNPSRQLPAGAMGIVWAKGPGLFSDFAHREGRSAAPTHERWFCTGDMGMLHEDGSLTVYGPKSRFTKIEGEIISHEEVEQLMHKFLHAEEPSDAPRLAIVGAPDERTGLEQLVLLSTIHQTVGPHDVITLRYDITNAHRSPLMAPGRIVALRAIPTLPGGGVNYALCRALAFRVLGISSS